MRRLSVPAIAASILGAAASATRTIDATGLTVAPGFIDPHTHAAGDLSASQRKSNVNYLMQGVTTVVTNNDGGISTDSRRQRRAPRKYGTFPKLFREYVREKKVLTLERAVERSSSRSAKMLGLKERGTIAKGMYADIAVFDFSTLTDRATYEQPTLLAEGMRYVFVNGALAVDEGKCTGVLPGRVLRR